MNRRILLQGIALGGTAAALAACTTTTNGSVTTVTLNVAQVDGWVQALMNGAMLVSGLTGVTGTPFGLAIAAIAPIIAADAKAFDTAVNGQLVFTYDRTTPAAVVNSLVADGQKLVNAVTTAVSQVPADIKATVDQYLAAIKTLVSVFQAAAGTSVAGVEIGGMTEAQAMAVLHR